MRNSIALLLCFGLIFLISCNRPNSVYDTKGDILWVINGDEYSVHCDRYNKCQNLNFDYHPELMRFSISGNDGGNDGIFISIYDDLKIDSPMVFDRYDYMEVFNGRLGPDCDHFKLDRNSSYYFEVSIDTVSHTANGEFYFNAINECDVQDTLQISYGYFNIEYR